MLLSSWKQKSRHLVWRPGSGAGQKAGNQARLIQQTLTPDIAREKREQLEAKAEPKDKLKAVPKAELQTKFKAKCEGKIKFKVRSPSAAVALRAL
jgi:hypothetical protein